MRVGTWRAGAVLAVALPGSLIGCRDAPADDWLVVPDERIGPITPATTEDELTEWFDQASVTSGGIELGEGEVRAGTILFPGQPGAVEIVWSRPGACPALLILRGGPSPWHTSGGIALGTTLDELEGLNGGPFTFAGFAFDGAGAILDWQGGHLAEDHEVPEPFLARLGPVEPGALERLSEDEAAVVIGDRPVSSESPVARSLGLVVVSMEVRWARLDGPPSPACEAGRP